MCIHIYQDLLNKFGSSWKNIAFNKKQKTPLSRDFLYSLQLYVYFKVALYLYIICT
jgi:hypothetical protein